MAAHESNPRPVRQFEYRRLIAAAPDLNFAQRSLARACADYASKDGTSVYPGVDELADYLGCGKRTVERWLPTLVTGGYLILVRKGRGRGPGKGGKNSEYRLSQPATLAARQDGVNPPLMQSQPATDAESTRHSDGDSTRPWTPPVLDQEKPFKASPGEEDKPRESSVDAWAREQAALRAEYERLKAAGELSFDEEFGDDPATVLRERAQRKAAGGHATSRLFGGQPFDPLGDVPGDGQQDGSGRYKSGEEATG